MTRRKSTPLLGVSDAPVSFRIKHVLVWSQADAKHWITLENEVLLQTHEWDRAVKKIRTKIGHRFSIMAMVEDGADRDAARNFIVGG